MQFGKTVWIPFILQALVLLGAGWGYATSQEHRITIIEESLKVQASTIEKLASTQQMLAGQVQDIQRTQDKLVSLEDFIHRPLNSREFNRGK